MGPESLVPLQYMSKLSDSVGKGGSNLRPDVVTVQTLLNGKAAKTATPLKIDGICGPKTTAAIAGFQHRAMRVAHPDGLIMRHGPTWKHLVGTPKHPGVSHSHPFAAGHTHSTAAPAHQDVTPAKLLVNQPAIRAMLDTIGYSEGTGTEYGTIVHGTVIKAPDAAYVGKRNVVVTDFSQHPNLLVQVNKSLQSTAAGRYQFLHGTWTALAMPDFTPASQDEAAVKLFQRRKMTGPLLNGDFDTAVQRGSLEWASLPDAKKGGQSHYGGQPARTLAQLRLKFLASFGLYAKR